jgi:MoxR-like ATPase
MEERQVSIDGQTLPLSERFMVLATQNPIEQEGTYPLPEAQTDRFLLKLRLDYPKADEEKEIFARYGDGREFHDFKALGLARLPEGDWIGRCRQRARQLRIEKGIIDYVHRIVTSTRVSPHLYLGASPRGGLALLRASQCLAALRGKDYVTPDEVKQMALPALRHRLILRPEAEMEGLTPDRIVRQILETLPVPR